MVPCCLSPQQRVPCPPHPHPLSRYNIAYDAMKTPVFGCCYCWSCSFPEKRKLDELCFILLLPLSALRRGTGCVRSWQKWKPSGTFYVDRWTPFRSILTPVLMWFPKMSFRETEVICVSRGFEWFYSDCRKCI